MLTLAFVLTQTHTHTHTHTQLQVPATVCRARVAGADKAPRNQAVRVVISPFCTHRKGWEHCSSGRFCDLFATIESLATDKSGPCD